MKARHIAGSLKASLALGSVHVEGGLNGHSAAAALAQSLGISELPTIAVWPDGLDDGQLPRDSQPLLVPVGSYPDLGQREALLARIGTTATPSVPLLSAANYHTRCGPSAWDVTAAAARTAVCHQAPAATTLSATAPTAQPHSQRTHYRAHLPRTTAAPAARTTAAHLPRSHRNTGHRPPIAGRAAVLRPPLRASARRPMVCSGGFGL